MMDLALIFWLTVALAEGVCLLAGYRLQQEIRSQQVDEHKRLWQHIEDLESDKRALTESLCRAEGKPFIPVRRADYTASEGWFDGKPSVTIGPKGAA